MKKQKRNAQVKFSTTKKKSRRKIKRVDAGVPLDVQNARLFFLENGYDPIPLQARSKSPIARLWQTKPTMWQWNEAGHDVNIGLRANGLKSFFDPDDKTIPGTSENIIRFMAGLGYQEGDYPLVKTPSGSYHLYVTFSGLMQGSKRNFKPDVGAGDFRFGPGAYVGTIPSVTDVGGYELISGDIARLPLVDLNDVSKVININNAKVPERKKRMSRSALALAKGIGGEKYKSRSEGEAALMLSLINSGFSYEEIKDIFDKYPVLGHYKNKHESIGKAEASRWLYMTYQNALDFSEHESPVRRMLARFLERVEVLPWSNSNNRQVFLSHLKIAHKVGRLDYAASVRDLALEAGIGLAAVSSHTHKLLEKGFLTIEKKEYGTLARVYVLKVDKIEHSLESPDVRECSDMSCFEVEKHDAFRNGPGRLGRRAGEIYALLLKNQLTVKEIEERSGANPRTIKRALKKMRSKVIDRTTGEIIEMVSEEEGKWHANLVDLNLVAEIMGTYGARNRQQAQYQKERRDYARELDLGSLRKQLESESQS